MVGVRWSEDDLKAHQARMAGHRTVPRPAPPVAAAPACVPADAPPRSRRKLKRPEQDLHRACIALLDAALPPPWRAVHVPNGGQRARVEAAIMAGMGVRKGFPDLILLGPTHFVAIELKAVSNRTGLTPEQESWRDWFRAIGAPWFVVRTTDELEAACADAGVPLRVRAQ